MRRVVWVALLLVFAAACQLTKPDPAAETTARAFYDDLRHGSYESLQARFPARLRNPAALAEILRLKVLIPAGEPRASRVVAWNRSEIPGQGPSESIAVEYDYPGRSTLLSLVLAHPIGQSSGWEVATVKLNAATDAQLERNGFGLGGKSAAQLGFLAYVIAAPLTMLFAMIKVAATPGLKNRWLWIALSSVGVMALRMDWASGVLNIDWFSVQVGGAYIGSGPSRFDPWVLAATFPIGALLILGGIWASPRLNRTPPADRG